MLSIASDFERHFELVLGNSNDLVSRCQRLRYTVFCQEYSILNSGNNTKRTESDNYDDRSVHGLLKYRRTNTDIATVRIILCDEQEPESLFPIEKFELLRRKLRDQNWRVPRQFLGEISRFCVMRYFRRRRGESENLHGISESLCDYDWHTLNRWYPHITLGLFRMVLQLSKNNGVKYWFALMEPSLIRLLSKVGIEFIPVGPVVEYFGLRQPCVGYIEDIMEGVQQRRPEVMRFLLCDLIREQVLVEA